MAIAIGVAISRLVAPQESVRGHQPWGKPDENDGRVNTCGGFDQKRSALNAAVNRLNGIDKNTKYIRADASARWQRMVIHRRRLRPKSLRAHRYVVAVIWWMTVGS